MRAVVIVQQSVDHWQIEWNKRSRIVVVRLKCRPAGGRPADVRLLSWISLQLLRTHAMEDDPLSFQPPYSRNSYKNTLLHVNTHHNDKQTNLINQSINQKSIIRYKNPDKSISLDFHSDVEQVYKKYISHSALFIWQPGQMTKHGHCHCWTVFT